MKRRFTILTAALALLTFLAVPMGMWGQSRESITASYGWEDADDASQWTISSAIVKTSGQGNTGTYAGKINTNTTTVQYNDKVNVTSFSYALKRTSTNSNYSVYIQTSTDGQTWNTVDTHAMSSFGNGTYTTVTKTFDGNTAYFVRFYCNNTTATRYVDDVTIVYNTTASTTFTVNYDCNGGETDCPENVSGIAPGTSITLASAPSRQHYNFVGWTYGATTYNPGDSYTVNSNVTFTAQWEPDGTYGEGSICFSSQSSCTAINSQSVTGEDDLGNTWTITTVGTSSFTSNSGYYQVGSGNSPATSITFTTTLDEEVNVTDFSATFGGFNATRASVALKVDNTQVGSGTLNGGDDVTVSSSSAQIGTTLTVIVTPTAGGVKCYNISYAYETIDNPAVATTTTINVPQNFNTDIYQGTNAGTLTATVKDNENNTISGATVTWSSSNTGVATIDASGAVTLVAVGTTTITASYAGVEDEYRPSEGTYELTVTDSNAPGTQNNPYTVAQARAAIDANTGITGVYATGIIYQVDSYNSNYNSITYWISDDGTSSNPLEVYSGISGIEGFTFSSKDDLRVGDVVVVKGNLKKFNNSVYEFDYNNQLVSLVRPNQYTLTATMSHVADFTIFAGDEIVSGPDPENPSQTVQVSAGTTVGVSIGGMENCYLFSSLTVNGSTTGVNQDNPDDLYFEFTMPDGDAEIDVTTTAARSFTLTVVGMDNVSFDMSMGYNSTEVTITDGTASICEQMHVIIDDLTVPSGFVLEPITLTYGNTTEEVNPALGFTMPSSDAMLTFTTHEAETFTYTKVTSVTPGKHYIIVTSSTDSNGKYHAMGGKNSGSSYMDPVEVSVDNNTVTVAENEGVAEILIGGTIDHYTLHTSEGYLVGGNKSMNTNGSEESTWGISFDDDQAVITWTINTTEYSIQYNSSNPRFACYSSSQAKVCLYEKDEPATETYELPITGYNEGGGWNLIASPVATPITPSAGNGFITAANTETNKPTFDLYRFNQAAALEWENYQQHSNDFNIVSGQGYLYANENTVTLTFEGKPYNGNGLVPLRYVEDKNFTGWNLIGNPFNSNAKLDMACYTISGNAINMTAYTAGSYTVAPCEGVMVKVTEEGQTAATFTKVTQGQAPQIKQLEMTVAQQVMSRGTATSMVHDNAIVNFNAGSQLEKFPFNADAAELYIPQDGKDYAIVSSEAQGEMPVNFKAKENGTYTLSIDVEGMEMNYLHLIDNKTGNDVDLLQTPSYSFEAKTTDYESRFKLVFVANNEDSVSAGSETFAFFSNGSFVINNEDNAELQVIDITGRIVKSESINGCANVNVNAAPGVYMLRLVNGDNVKTQKVVVK